MYLLNKDNFLINVIMPALESLRLKFHQNVELDSYQKRVVLVHFLSS